MRPSEAAEILRVTPRTLIRMASRGELQVITLPSGHRRYNAEQVQRLAGGTADTES